jgi:hypothetical protein
MAYIYSEGNVTWNVFDRLDLGLIGQDCVCFGFIYLFSRWVVG